MEKLRTWQLTVIACFTAFVCYALGKGIYVGSFWGITSAVASIVATLIFVNICKKMNELEEEEQY